MANAVVASWKECIKELQMAVDTDWQDVIPADAADALGAFVQRVQMLKQQLPLPHAAWKRLVQDVQATCQLAALCGQALQQRRVHAHVLSMACIALNAWLGAAMQSMQASPASRAAATVRQQLVSSQVLEHLGPGMDTTADELREAVEVLSLYTAKAAAAAAAAAAAETATPDIDLLSEVVQVIDTAGMCCSDLLSTFMMVNGMLATGERLFCSAAWPAAPAAVRLSRTVIQSRSKLQTLRRQQPLGDLFDSIEIQPEGALRSVLRVLSLLAFEVIESRPVLQAEQLLHSPSGAAALLLLPEFASCLATVLLVAVLGLDTCGAGAAAFAATCRAGSSGQRSSHTSRLLRLQERAGSSSVGGSAGSDSSSRLHNGVGLDSLTPLSCSLFGVLGVTREAVLQAAVLAKPLGLTTLPVLAAWVKAYQTVSKHQVLKGLYTYGTLTTRTMLQLQTDMLMSLALMQMTASIPDSMPGVQAARAEVYQLQCEPLNMFWKMVGQQKLRRTAAYTGPQLALHLLPCAPHHHQQQQQEQQELFPGQQQHEEEDQQQKPDQQQQQQHPDQQQQQQHQQPPPSAQQQQQEELLPPGQQQHQEEDQQQQQHQQLPPPAQRHQQQQQQQQLPPGQQDQAAEWCAVAPTEALLSELLPLLTHFCRTQLQQQEQQPAASPQQQSNPLPAGVHETLLYLRTLLLLCSVVPAPSGAVDTVSSPAAVAAAAGGDTSKAHGYVLAACDTLMANAAEIISIFEAALRRTSAALLPTAGVASAGGAGSVSTTAGAATASSDGAAVPQLLQDLAGILLQLCAEKMSFPHTPAPLVMLALAAGPGSKTQSQLYSLLAAMVKVARCSMGTLKEAARAQYCAAAADAARALLTGPTGKLVTPAAADAAAECSSGPADAVALLPSVVIIGRCCIQWAEHMLASTSTLPEEQQQHQQHESQQEKLGIDVNQTLYTVQQWLTAGNTCEQLAAAGYAPPAVLQQLQKRLQERPEEHLQEHPEERLAGGTAAGTPALQDSTSDSAAPLMAAQELSDTATAAAAAAALREAQDLKSLGRALCSFAVPCLCNNPGCTSMAGLSELASVSGRSCVCGGCRVARYCGRACQRAVWKQHKPVCAALSAAAAGEAGAAATAAASAACVS